MVNPNKECTERQDPLQLREEHLPKTATPRADGAFNRALSVTREQTLMLLAVSNKNLLTEDKNNYGLTCLSPRIN